MRSCRMKIKEMEPARWQALFLLSRDTWNLEGRPCVVCLLAGYIGFKGC